MELLSQLLTPALGIAISPLPIVGLILILLGENAKGNSVFFSIGWLIGNLTTFILALFFMGVTTSESGDTNLIQKLVFAVLGGLLIFIAIKTFMKRTKVGEEPKTPKWFAKMTSLKPMGAVGFGVVLSSANPKNLLLSLSAGAAAGAVTQSISEDGLAILLFGLIATSTIVIPTILFSVMGDKISHKLAEMKNWLIYNNDTITAVMLLFIGIKILGKAF
ncbi:GAP family protein [Vagococcus sp. BWB3-3]|uniref:GAP family protein n=1 Tax=Vagococcus allomyrinae TaxID=2794353 RepID=A0A940SU26_9ENTE|nr:GAP family protein [Vagococcus allomyrinae]MBP1040304.1 GAP family protein [Vagococcus allomyrinae]